MSQLPLLDTYADVLRKAQRGLGLSDAELAERAGISAVQLEQFKTAFSETAAIKIARALNLNAAAFVELGTNSWRPEPLDPPGLACFTTVYRDTTVNSYLTYDARAKCAVAFDTGMSCQGMLDFAQQQQLKIELILLTHKHPDHITDLAKLVSATGAPVHASELEDVRAALPFEAGTIFRVGNMKIECRLTSGHARGGISYVVSGLLRRLAIVGDAMFAASIGGGMISYEEALRTNRNELFSLPDETVICPGHGPLTTIGEQKKHNPFFPEFRK